jgi:hypothetical protein
MKIGEAIEIAQALDGWKGWHCLSVDLWSHSLTDADGYKVRLSKLPNMHAEVTTPGIDAARTQLTAIEAGETYPDMRPWFYGFIDAIHGQWVRIELFAPGTNYAAGAKDPEWGKDPRGIRLNVRGYHNDLDGGITVRVEPPEETANEPGK